MCTKPPGTLRDRTEASMILHARAMQWLLTHPDENERGFIAWLESQEWRDSQENWTEILQYDAHEIGPLIWKMFAMLE